MKKKFLKTLTVLMSVAMLTTGTVNAKIISNIVTLNFKVEHNYDIQVTQDEMIQKFFVGEPVEINGTIHNNQALLKGTIKATEQEVAPRQMAGFEDVTATVSYNAYDAEGNPIDDVVQDIVVDTDGNFEMGINYVDANWRVPKRNEWGITETVRISVYKNRGGTDVEVASQAVDYRLYKADYAISGYYTREHDPENNQYIITYKIGGIQGGHGTEDLLKKQFDMDYIKNPTWKITDSDGTLIPVESITVMPNKGGVQEIRGVILEADKILDKSYKFTFSFEYSEEVMSMIEGTGGFGGTIRLYIPVHVEATQHDGQKLTVRATRTTIDYAPDGHKDKPIDIIMEFPTTTSPAEVVIKDESGANVTLQPMEGTTNKYKLGTIPVGTDEIIIEAAVKSSDAGRVYGEIAE